MKSRSVAIVLAFFLGGFGAHKFYLNRPGEGITYFLLSWTFIPLFCSLIEVIYYLSISELKFRKKYCGYVEPEPDLTGVSFSPDGTVMTIDRNGVKSIYSLSAPWACDTATYVGEQK